jgi:signal transduction histidine kinase
LSALWSALSTPQGSIKGYLVWGLGLLLLGVEALVWRLADTNDLEPLLAAGIRIGFSLLAFAWLVRKALRPIQQLGETLQAQGDEEVPAQPSELKPVNDAINELLRQQSGAVERQQRFLADASHQLRTPFAVLRTQIQGTLSGQLESRETLTKMLATVDRSSQLVTQLLSQAKVGQLVVDAHWQDVDLATVAKEVCLEFAPLMARKRLDFSLETSSLLLRTDPWLAGELVRNLLSNAIHHSPKGKSLGMVVRSLPGEAELVVWDQGGGIDETVQARLFEPFKSASGGTGIGLGLSICRQIAESMQAEVALFNRVQDGKVIGLDAVVRWPQSSVVLAGAGLPGEDLS